MLSPRKQTDLDCTLAEPGDTSAVSDMRNSPMSRFAIQVVGQGAFNVILQGSLNQNQWSALVTTTTTGAIKWSDRSVVGAVRYLRVLLESGSDVQVSAVALP